MKNLIILVIIALCMMIMTACGEKTYNIGDTCPAGGIVFYDKGEITDGWRYLSAAPASSEFNAEWGASAVNVTGTSTEVGFGRANTQIIAAKLQELGQKGHAAQKCLELNINGKNDWFLPSNGELNLMYENLHAEGFGDFGKGTGEDWMKWFYWSSTQYYDNTDFVWLLNFLNGSQSSYNKAIDLRVRAIRAFSVKKQNNSQTVSDSSEKNVSGTATQTHDYKYWFTIPEFGLKATLVTPEILQYYTSRFDLGMNLIFVTSTPLQDFRYLEIQYDLDNIIELREINKIDVLTPEIPLVMDWMESGASPNRGFSFLDSNGKTRYFWINANNADPPEGNYTKVLLGEKPGFKLYSVGDIGPAGGWIFYDKGSFTDGWRYLEAAPANTEFNAEWGAYTGSFKDWTWRGIDVPGTSTRIGTGRSNTQIINAKLAELGETGRASQRCVALEISGYTDWFLPSYNELNLMYQNLYEKGLGDFRKGTNSEPWMNSTYWSSSQKDNLNAWIRIFGYGFGNDDNKIRSARVRAIRAV